MQIISILMNCYNCEKYLKESINSIYSQTFNDWEIIFIDNCSTDNSNNIATSFNDKLKYYKTDKLIPLGEARNFGLQFCKGNFLAFLDTDDIWLPNKLEQQIKLMRSNDFQMVYSGVIYIDKNSNEFATDIPKAQSGNVFAQQLLRYEINMQSVIIKNNININFNINMQFSPDFDLFMKIASKYQVGVINEPLVKYRKLSNSLTSKKIDRWWIETKETLDNIFIEQPELAIKYSNEKNIAYAKTTYYKALYLISINSWKQAQEELSSIKNINLIYKILYFLSFSKTAWKFAHKFKK
jgi:glycosyltransferase involved in cell wall biosynthesis